MAGGAPRSIKVGTIASPCRYDASVCHTRCNWQVCDRLRSCIMPDRWPPSPIWDRALVPVLVQKAASKAKVLNRERVRSIGLGVYGAITRFQALASAGNAGSSAARERPLAEKV
jgi:hypothetical protein